MGHRSVRTSPNDLPIRKIIFRIHWNAGHWISKTILPVGMSDGLLRKLSRRSLILVIVKDPKTHVLVALNMWWPLHFANKRGCVFPMVIWPVFRMGQYRVTDHPYHAPQFIPWWSNFTQGKWKYLAYLLAFTLCRNSKSWNISEMQRPSHVQNHLQMRVGLFHFHAYHRSTEKFQADLPLCRGM